MHEAQRVETGVGGQQRLFLFEVERQERGEQVNLLERLGNLLVQAQDGQARLRVDDFEDAAGFLEDGLLERLVLGAAVGRRRQRAVARQEERLLLLGGKRGGAVQALHDDLQTFLVAIELLDHRARADVEQVAEPGGGQVGIFLGDDQERLVLARHGGLDGAQRLLAPMASGIIRPGYRTVFFNRQHGEAVDFIAHGHGLSGVTMTSSIPSRYSLRSERSSRRHGRRTVRSKRL